MSRMTDAEVTRRIVDRIERGIRREGLMGAEGGAEARRRLFAACPWAQWRQDDHRGADPRWDAYQREAERAMTRLFAPAAGPVEVEAEGAAPLAILPELEAWAEARRVAVRRPELSEGKAESPGPETLDMFAEGGAA